MKVGIIKPVKDYNKKNYQEPVRFKLEIFDDAPELLEALRDKITEWMDEKK